MSITAEFMDAVKSGKKTRVRIMLKDIMLIDPSLQSFNEMLTYADNYMSNLYDEHNGENLKKDPSAWDESYMNSQMVYVVNNFSKERVELLKNIVQKIYLPQKQSKSSVIVSGAVKETKNLNFSALMIAVVGAIGLIYGYIDASTVITIFGGVVLVVGIIMNLLQFK